MATKSEKTPAPVVNYSGMNVLQKLQIARAKFLQAGVKKSGKNIHLEFMYFELQDIVPTATAIFAEVGLLMVPSIKGDTAIARVYNTDMRNEEPVVFEAPFTPIDPIISNSGKEVTNKMQAMGSSITYMRRYLWQLVLDIIEADSIDNTSGAGADDDISIPLPQPVRKAPVTQEQRQEIKNELTSAPEGAATEEQVTELKSRLKALLEMDAEQESFVQSIAVKTEGFTKLTADVCAQLITGVNDMLAAYTPQEG